MLEERSQPGRVLYRFAHAFFRQTLYEEMIAPRRLRLHQEVARALEAQYGARREEHAAELAEHYAQSTDRADLAKAVEYGELAAQRAMSVFAYAEAASHLERCLAVQEVLDLDDKAKRCDLLLALGEALILAGEPRRVFAEVAEEAFGLAEALGDDERASRACVNATTSLMRYGTPALAGVPEFRRWAEREDQHAADGSYGRVEADINLALVLLADGKWEEAWSLRLRALELARQLAIPDLLFRTVSRILGPGLSIQFAKAGVGLADEFSKSPRDGVSGSVLANVLLFGGRVLLSHGERKRAEELWREAREVAERVRDLNISAQVELHQEATLATLDGHLDEAPKIAERYLTRIDEMGSPVRGRFQASNTVFAALFYLGRSEEALVSQTEAAKAAGAEDQALQIAHSTLGIARLGRKEDAQNALRQVMTRWHIGPESDWAPAQLVVELCEVAALVGDSDAAAVLAGRLAPVADWVSLGSFLGSCPARVLGMASALLGKPDEARAYYMQALEVCAKVRFRPEIALTRLQLAELLLEHYPDERPAAIEHLDFAIAEFRDMKMQPSLERALGHRGLLKA